MVRGCCRSEVLSGMRFFPEAISAGRPSQPSNAGGSAAIWNEDRSTPEMASPLMMSLRLSLRCSGLRWP
jgi:hypothetical protein